MRWRSMMPQRMAILSTPVPPEERSTNRTIACWLRCYLTLLMFSTHVLELISRSLSQSIFSKWLELDKFKAWKRESEFEFCPCPYRGTGRYFWFFSGNNNHWINVHLWSLMLLECPSDLLSELFLWIDLQHIDFDRASRTSPQFHIQVGNFNSMEHNMVWTPMFKARFRCVPVRFIKNVDLMKDRYGPYLW